MKLYCIEVHKEMGEIFVFHKRYDHIPTRNEILKAIDEEDCGYDDNYGKFEYWEVKE